MDLSSAGLVVLNLNTAIFFPDAVETSRRGQEIAYWAKNNRVAVKMNVATEKFYQACQGSTTVAEAVASCAKTFEMPEAEITAAVLDLLQRLIATGFVTLAAVPQGRKIVASPARYAPIILYLHLGVQCNLHCVYCYNVEHRKQELTALPLSFQEYADLIEQAAGSGVKHLNFTGGEPLLSPHWQPLADKARSLGLSLTLLTNGTLITVKNASDIKRLFAQVIISLDSPDPVVHDKLRGIGSHKKIMAGMACLRDVAFEGLVVRPVVTRHNVHTIKDFPAFMARFCDNARFMTTVYIPNSIAEEQDLQLLPAQEDYRAAMQAFGAALETVRGKVSPEEGDLEGQVRCGAAAGILSIDFNGDVYPCQAIHDPAMRLGNIRERGYYAIGKDACQAKAYRELHVGHVEICTECNFNEICGGGCRAAAFKLYRRLTAFNANMCDYNKMCAWDVIWGHLGGAEEDVSHFSIAACHSCA